MKAILFYLISSFLAIIFVFPQLVFAQELKDCGQVKTSTWRGETTYDVCGTEYCKDGQWKRTCYSSENPNCRCDSQNNCEYTSAQSCSIAPEVKQCHQVKTRNWRGVTTYDKCGQEYCEDGVYKIQCYSSENNSCRCDSQNNCEYTSGDICGTSTPPTPQQPSQPTEPEKPADQASPAPETPKQETPTEQQKAAPKKPVRILITQFDQPTQTLDPSANLNEVKIQLNFNPIDLGSGQQGNAANVKFEVGYDYFNKEVIAYYIQFKLKQKVAENVSPAENQPKNVKVLVLKYFPLDTTGTKLNSNITLMSTPLSQIRAFTDSLTTILVDDLTKASKYHGYKTNSQPALTYSITDSKEFLEAIPLSDRRAFDKPEKGFRPDYRKVLNDTNICDYVDNKGVSQVWIWSYHTKQVEIDESNVSMGTDSKTFWNHGDYGDVSNSEQVNDLPTCKKTYALYNYNYERSVGEALENHGHHIEAVLRFIDYDLFWNKFVKPNGDKNIVNHCGWVHSPPNVTDGNTPKGGQYDWVNETSVQSDCEDWKPDGGGQVKDVNCHTWYQYSAGNVCPKDSGGFSTDAGAQYKIWWMQNLPGMNNGLNYKGNSLRNWWTFIADFDSALVAGKTLVSKPNKITLQSADSISQSDPNYLPPASLDHPDYPKNDFSTLPTPPSGTSQQSLTQPPQSTGQQQITPSSSTSIADKNVYDLTGDGVVNTIDVSKFLQLWRSGSCNQIDFDKNGICNSFDYTKLKENF